MMAAMNNVGEILPVFTIGDKFKESGCGLPHEHAQREYQHGREGDAGADGRSDDTI